MAAELDSFDQKIIKVLTSDGRISVTALADQIGLSKSPTQARLRRLEEGGVIRGYKALFDPMRLGRDHVTFVEVKLKETSEAALVEFNAATQEVPEIEECHMIAGKMDYLLKVRSASLSGYRSVLAKKISTLPNVAYISSHVSMQTVKEDGLPPNEDFPCKA